MRGAAVFLPKAKPIFAAEVARSLSKQKYKIPKDRRISMLLKEVRRL
jgi:hypothetical protein